MTCSEERHTHSPEVREPEGSGVVGYAAIKYAAIVIIVLAILPSWPVHHPPHRLSRRCTCSESLR